MTRPKVASLGYGFVAQACSSATNFGLFIVGGRLLGVSGLGALSVGFFAYLLLLSLLRALLTDPVIAASSAYRAADRAASARSAISLAVASTASACLLIVILGSVLSRQVVHGILLFAPWLVPALVQDLGRSLIFRDRTGWSAVLSDLTWLLVMLALVPFAITTENDWAVVGCWGAGSLAGATVVLRQLRWRPRSLAVALTWWRSQIWPFGRWLGLQAVLYSAISFVAVLALVSILGAYDFGGLVAVQTVLTPLTLLGTAIALPGLPHLSRIIRASRRQALGVAAQLGGLLTFLTGMYVLLVYWFPNTLSIVFGSSFAAFRSLIIPISLGQLLAAPAVPLMLFLKADRRGPAIFMLSTLQVLLYLALSVGLAISLGLTGAAWATAGSNAIIGLALLAVIHSEITGPHAHPRI